jgi:hypothetical protein
VRSSCIAAAARWPIYADASCARAAGKAEWAARRGKAERRGKARRAAVEAAAAPEIRVKEDKPAQPTGEQRGKPLPEGTVAAPDPVLAGAESATEASRVKAIQAPARQASPRRAAPRVAAAQRTMPGAAAA